MPQRTILVAEADPGVRLLFSEALRDEGYRIRLVEPRDLRVCDLMAVTPDLLLLELTPGTIGPRLKLLTQLRRLVDSTGLPILVSSTDQNMLAERACEIRRLGCAVLAKPFSLDELQRVVGHCLSRLEKRRAPRPTRRRQPISPRSS